LNSILDEDDYSKILPEQIDFFVSKYLIDINSTNIINSPRNMNKDESTVIGKHTFHKPISKLI
jgi:hypothetical protein